MDDYYGNEQPIGTDMNDIFYGEDDPSPKSKKSKKGKKPKDERKFKEKHPKIFRVFVCLGIAMIIFLTGFIVGRCTYDRFDTYTIPASPPTTTTAPLKVENTSTYTVQANDYWTSLAKTYSTTVKHLVELNKDALKGRKKDKYGYPYLYKGDKIVVPS